MKKKKGPWFEPGFDEALKAAILADWQEAAPLSCQDESRRWARLLLEKNPEIDLEIHEGFYYVKGNLNEAEGHMWLVSDGCIFDPTSAQFKGTPDFQFYDTHQYYEGEDLLEHLREYGMKPRGLAVKGPSSGR